MGKTDQVPVYQEPCEDERCRSPGAKVWYCVDCSCRFCEDCWRFQPSHREGKTARDGKPHEQIDYYIANCLESILSPTNDSAEIRRLHDEDEKYTWFGWSKLEDQNPTFEDFGAYVSLMAASTRDCLEPKYPRLVSFVGETSAGKSTLINMLIKLNDPWREGGQDSKLFAAPVCGSLTDFNIPTSADVHLYADPKTFYGKRPILLADCEGMNGGEETPIAKRKKLATEARELIKLAGERTKSRFEISWADPKQHNAERGTREFAVSELYPRILYTFSDVVVFVSRNAKTFQSGALKKLLEWGHRSLEKSTNQPALPRAIIVLNATEIGVDESEWDIEYATSSLLNGVENALHPQLGVPSFQEYAKFWEAKGDRIKSVGDMIRRYYASFKVVAIPRGGRYSILHRQVQALHGCIVQCCDDSRRDREKARLQFTSEALQVYLQAAFQHFRSTIDEPFDFKEVSFRVNPIPANFGGRILELAEAIYASHRESHQRPTIETVFTGLAGIVASCVLLDVERYRKGNASDVIRQYESHFVFALEEFCESAMPCSFKNKKGEYCINVSSRHLSKGHQNSKGKIIGSGRYVSSDYFNYKAFAATFTKLVGGHVKKLESKLQAKLSHAADGGISTEAQAWKLHARTIADYYKPHESKKRVVRHWACLCCLMSAPDYALPCGHTLCSTCAQAFGVREDDTTLTLTCCPFHPDDQAWSRPWRIRLKPEFAGVRILSLDGGGARGIVELEVLRLLQEELGERLPLQSFFDLIVGTSTGSIIALALGVLHWPVKECASKFGELCTTAFTKRMTYMALRSKVTATFVRGSMYKTEHLHAALKEALGETKIFGGSGKTSQSYDIKVAATSTDIWARNAIILANYNRQGQDYANHIFQRPSDPNEELKVWEVAAASTAAPPYFSPFWHPVTNREYLDGALYNNNPARVASREARLLWPEVAKIAPDILLSIGTGKRFDTDLDVQEEMTGKDLHKPKSKHYVISPVEGPPTKEPSKESLTSGANGNVQQGKSTQARGSSRTDRLVEMWGKWRPQLSEQRGPSVSVKRKLVQGVNAVTTRFKRVIDAEIAWNMFLDERDTPDKDRYIRINPEMNAVPPLDSVDLLDALQVTTSNAVPREMIQNIALQLVASTFYFKKTSCEAQESHQYICQGIIRCRLESISGEPSEVMELGRYLRSRFRSRAPAFFAIYEENEKSFQSIPFLPATIEMMCTEGTFFAPKLSINLSHESVAVNIELRFPGSSALDNERCYNISGFPRRLAAEEPLRDVLRRRHS